MTVAELIERLSELDPTLKVRVYNSNQFGYPTWEVVEDAYEHGDRFNDEISVRIY